MTGGDHVVTLGAGSDVLTLSANAYSFAVGTPVRVTDFQTGTDTLALDQYLATALQGWDKTTNPLAIGHLKLVQSGTDTLLQLDRDGSAGNGYGFSTLLTFANTSAANVTARDLGYARNSSAAATDELPMPSFDLSQADLLPLHHTVIG